MDKTLKSRNCFPNENRKYRSRSRTPPKDFGKTNSKSEFIPFPSTKTSPVQIQAPWVKPSTIKFEDPVLMLHEEILDFFDFMQPTLNDKQMRDDLVQRIRTVTKELWPDSEISVFGSYETGLWLPNSDLDIAVLTSNPESTEEMINSLAQKLCLLGMISEMDRILSATVPILKFKDKVSGVYVDVCFNTENGVVGANIVKSYLARYPEAKYLVCVIKYFLKQRALNDTYSGGIGSFLLFCMVIASIQHHPSRRLDKSCFYRFTLGHYLVFFLKLFGEEFNYEQNGISIKGEGVFFKKSTKPWILNDRSVGLAVECPQNPETDLGKCSFAIDTVKKALSHAYKLLCAQSKKIAPTPLGLIIRVDETVVMRSRLG